MKNRNNYETHIKYAGCDEVEVYKWWSGEIAKQFLKDNEWDDKVEWKELRFIGE